MPLNLYNGMFFPACIFDSVYPPVTVFSPVSKKEFKIHIFKLLPKLIIGKNNATVSEFFVLDLSYDLSIAFSDLDPPMISQFLILH